jgi:hypothetical protein
MRDDKHSTGEDPVKNADGTPRDGLSVSPPPPGERANKYQDQLNFVLNLVASNAHGDAVAAGKHFTSLFRKAETDIVSKATESVKHYKDTLCNPMALATQPPVAFAAMGLITGMFVAMAIHDSPEFRAEIEELTKERIPDLTKIVDFAEKLRDRRLGL